MLARDQLPLAAREAETGEAEAEKCERGGFGDAGILGDHDESLVIEAYLCIRALEQLDNGDLRARL